MADGSSLPNSAALAGFDDAERAAFLESGTCATVEEGHALLRSGGTNGSLFLILSGSVTVDRKIDDEEVWLATLGPGEMFGEMSMLDQSQATANLTAAGTVEVLEITSASLERLLDEQPRLAGKLWRNIASTLRQRLSDTNDLLLSYVDDEKKLYDSAEFKRLSGHL